MQEDFISHTVQITGSECSGWLHRARFTDGDQVMKIEDHMIQAASRCEIAQQKHIKHDIQEIKVDIPHGNKKLFFTDGFHIS